VTEAVADAGDEGGAVILRFVPRSNRNPVTPDAA
jgi:hypothetical protein